jgi:hypothetical protein
MPIMKKTWWFIAIVVIVLVGGALIWNGRGLQPSGVAVPKASQVVSSETAASPGALSGSGMAPRSPADLTIPVKYQFAGIRTVKTAADIEDLLARYPGDQRKAILAFYGSYGEGRSGGGQYAFDHVFAFHDEAQLAWLVSQGFPTPDDVLAAATMTTEDLERLSPVNFKAKAFYLARVAGESRQGTVEGGGKIVGLAGDVLSEGSAFGPYAYARYAIDTGDPGSALASYAYAKKLGDRRTDFMYAFADTHPNIPPLDVLVGYQLILSTTLQNPQLRNLGTLALRPKFEVFKNE